MYDRKTARHEAAHFVVAWVLECPDTCADITPEGQKPGNGGYSGGSETDGNFDKITSLLAGPVADCWGKTGAEIIEWEGQWIHRETDDWSRAIHTLAESGIDTENPTALNTALSWCLNATRSILTECQENWKEVEDCLVEHGRFGFRGKFPDQGEDAINKFFAHWEDDDGIPENVRVCVERLRREFYEFAHEPIYEDMTTKSDGKTSTATDML